jgi:aromatic ring-opening dioxygenase LigB subunit
MLVFGAIAPHGGDIISQIAAVTATMAKTRAAMRELGRRCAAAMPETVVVATPHGIIAEGVISIGATAMAAGILDGPSGGQVKAVFENDLELVAALEPEMERQGVPYVRLVGEEKKQSAVLPLDWGALVPLWFTAHPMKPRPKIVVLGPDRNLPRETLVRSGVAVARAAAVSGKRVAFIASCDLGHAHDPDGPYGFDPASAEHDALYCAAVAESDLARLLEWPEEFLETAKVDAFWQTLMLAGALGHTPMRGELLSYEAPTYFGMAVAAYEPG